MDEITVKPCPMCGGQPIVLVMRQGLEATVRVHCSGCGISGPAIFFAGRRAQRELLPDLATARRTAVKHWNRRTYGTDRPHEGFGAL